MSADGQIHSDLSTASPATTVRHVVLMRIDTQLDAVERARLEADLRGLVAEHPHAVRATLHGDLGRKPESPIAATWLVSMDFVSMADFEEYLASPLHKAFLADHQASMTSLMSIQVPI